ncbi:hypothetical protein OIU83_13570 [Flavobacterium sp. LS1R49]|uniref:Aspartyl protease n=1 Tax=Flavobacterium shii TaxID=2987687 RepID=A0A9X3C7J7_9FLAO|nr:hypothetical protein [Flavobacterium shii]MCV9928693.1 hypothetical protein [Flavobacterium shii]
MKIFKKIAATILFIIVLSLLGGYFYFDQKFTPDKNYLTVEKESEKIEPTWLGIDKNVLLVPIKFPEDTAKYYLQFDTGSEYTEFYYRSIKHLKEIKINNKIAETSFYIGNTKITSDKFKIADTGKETDKNDSIKIIGTLGADILENRKTIINLRENYLVFNLLNQPIEFQNKLIDFKFKRRKIIIQALLKGKSEKFLYDSGTSAFELLTSKEIWKDLKLPNSKIIIEKAQSKHNILTTFTAKSNNTILFKNKVIPLNEVTYVEGFSQTQYMLMKFSGMTGMLGNKIFLKNCIYIDCSENKVGID